MKKPEDQAHEDAGRQAFLRVAGADKEVDAFELRDILNGLYTKGTMHALFLNKRV